MTTEIEALAEANWHLRTAQEKREEEELKIKRERELGILAEQTRSRLLSQLGTNPKFQKAEAASDGESVLFTDKDKIFSFSDITRQIDGGQKRQTKLTIRTFSEDGLVMLERLQITTVDYVGIDDILQTAGGGIYFHRQSIDPLSRPEDHNNSEEALGGIVNMISGI